MKRLLLCLLGLAALHLSSIAQQPVQPYTATFWTTTTLHMQSGKSFIFTLRTVYTRDAAGNTRTERYQPTKGLPQDGTAPLERVSTGAISAQPPFPAVHPGGETVQVVDLGTALYVGFATQGSRQTYVDSNGQVVRTLETWFCPSLGVTTHMLSSDAKGNTTSGDLVSLQLDAPAAIDSVVAARMPNASSTGTAPAIPLTILYRSLFSLVHRMEQDRQANDPNRHVNMDEIEDHLRSKLQLSPAQWQALTTVSARVESYTRQHHEEARAFARQVHAAHSDSPLAPDMQASGHARLQRMQVDFNAHIAAEIDGVRAALGGDASKHVQAYLQGPLAASTRATPLHAARLQAGQGTAR